MKSILLFITILLSTIALQNCSESLTVQPAEFLLKFKNDTIPHRLSDIKFYKFDSISYSFVPNESLCKDSANQLIHDLQYITYNDSIGEGFLKFDKDIEYAVYSYSLDWIIYSRFDPRTKKLSSISYLSGKPCDNKEPLPNNPNILKFLLNFENDRDFRLSHIADTVRGYDYYKNDSIPNYKHIWDKERVHSYLDYYFNLDETTNVVEHLWLDSPYLANLILRQDKFEMNGVAMSFRKIDGKWLLEKLTVSTKEYPSILGVYEDLFSQNDLDDDVRLSIPTKKVTSAAAL